MKQRNLILVASADDLANWRGYLRERVDEEPKRNAPASLLRALETVRDGGNLRGTPYEEPEDAPQSAPEGQDAEEAPAPVPTPSRATKPAGARS